MNPKLLAFNCVFFRREEGIRESRRRITTWSIAACRAVQPAKRKEAGTAPDVIEPLPQPASTTLHRGRLSSTACKCSARPRVRRPSRPVRSSSTRDQPVKTSRPRHWRKPPKEDNELQRITRILGSSNNQMIPSIQELGFEWL